MVAVTLKLKKSIIKRINLNWLPAILKARIFAYNGETIKAIKACKYSDLYVLSKAGLHLQVIEKSKNPSVELALAYAATNQHEQAFAVIDKIGINKQSSIVLGILAIQNPSCIAKLLIDRKGFDKVKAYCHSSLHFESALQFSEKKITDWHNLALMNTILRSNYFNELSSYQPFRNMRK